MADKRKANLGRAFEGMIEQYLRGVVELTYWHRNYPPTRYVMVRGHLSAVPSGEGPPDFLVVSRGVAMEVEAKSFHGPRWPFDKLTDHQAAALDRVLAAGEANIRAGVLIGQMGVADELLAAWWVPWSQLGTLWWRHKVGVDGKASLTVPDLDTLGTRLHGVNFLSTVVDT